MNELPGPSDVADRVKAYTESPDNGYLRQELNELLQGYSNLTDPVERERISTALRDSGTLPSLALVESPRLDVMGESDGVKMEDLDHILSNPGEYDAVTHLAADYTKQNFYEIEEASTSMFGLGNLYDSDDLEAENFQDYSDAFEPGDDASGPELLPYQTDGSANEATTNYPVPVETNDLTGALDSLLASENPDAQDVFKVLEQLAQSGASEITLHDKNGNAFQGRLVVEPVAPGSDRSYVHLFVPDESGRERIALRAIAQDGTYTQEVGSDGVAVSFLGSKFAESDRINAVF